MAKGRMLQNRISKSQKMASLSNDTVRLLYTWMLSHLDVNGNFYADPILVNNLVFTRLGHPVKVVEKALDELNEKGLILKYRINGEIYLNYPDFFEKQPKLHPVRESYPEIPSLTKESILRKEEESIKEEEKKYKTKSNIRVNSTLLQTNSCLTHELVMSEKKQVKSNPGFDDFWKAYPRKVNKREAQDKWNRAKLPEFSIILQALELQKKTEQWQKDNGSFIPYPSTWINKERWNDEPEIKVQHRRMEMRCSKCGELSATLIGGERLCPKCN